MAGLLAAIVLAVLDAGSGDHTGILLEDLGFVVTFGTFPVIGCVLATRRPENSLGWLPLLQVFLTVGVMFVIVNLSLSRLSRRLEIRERRRTGVEVDKVAGLEDQLAVAEAAVARSTSLTLAAERKPC